MAREQLKEFRKSISKNCYEMAEEIGISYSMYKQIECGAKNPSLKTMQKFKEIFPAIDITDIFLI